MEELRTAACVECGVMVPLQHMEMHLLRGCGARDNSSRRPREPTNTLKIATSTALADESTTMATASAGSCHSRKDDDSDRDDTMECLNDSSPSFRRDRREGKTGSKSTSSGSSSDSSGARNYDRTGSYSDSSMEDMDRKPRAAPPTRRQHQQTMSVDSSSEEDSKPPARRRRRIQNTGQEVIDLSTDDSTRVARPTRSAATAPHVEDLTGNYHGPASATAPVISIDDDSEDEHGESKWACGNCTLLNPSNRPRCEACAARNPNYVRPPDATRREQLILDDHEAGALAAQLGRGYRPGSARSGGGPPSSRMGYAGIGGLFGAAVGAAGNWAQGRDPLRGALEGGTTGAFGGALLHQAMHMDANARSHTTSNAARSASTTDVASARSSVAMGAAGYPSGTAMPSNSRNGSRPRSSFRIDRTVEGGAEVLVMHDGSGLTTRITRSSIGGRGASRDQMELLLRQYSALQSLHGPSYGAGRRYAFQQQPDIDNMNYEQMLRAFGNGTENMGAQDTVISQLPTHELKDPQKELPEDARQCAICLDDFEKGETRMCLPCFHGFHEGCCQKWLRQNGKCPVCQHRVSTNSFSNDD